MPKKILYLFVIVSFLGFLDATYLTIKHYQGEPPSCNLLKGCENVTTSRFATVAGIPVALGGSLYYLAIFLASIAVLDTKKQSLLRTLGWFTIAGLVASLYFLYLQIFVIHFLCLYCLFSAATSTLLFILGMYTLRWLKKSSLETKNLPT